MKTARGFAPLVLLIVGLLFGAGIVFAYFQFYNKTSPSQITPQQDAVKQETASSSPSTAKDLNWKTYQGDGFSFKYFDGLVMDKQANSVHWGYSYDNKTITPDKMILINKTTPLNKPEVNGKLNSNTAITILGIDSSKKINVKGGTIEYYVISCGVDCYLSILQFQAKNRYYELRMDSAGGGWNRRDDIVISSFEITG